MKVKVKKTWHGAVSVKDYIVQKAIDKHEDLVISFNGETMTVPFFKLGSGYKSPKPLQSKHGTAPYFLIDFPWKPDPKGQTKLL